MPFEHKIEGKLMNSQTGSLKKKKLFPGIILITIL
jgi:hypothetical protein